MSWKIDERSWKTIGPFTMASERSNQTTGSAHLIGLPDGRRLRVLPDGRNTGLRRSRAITEALRAAERDTSTPEAGILLILGYLDVEGLEWAWADIEEDALGEWLAGWWQRMTREGEPRPWSRLREDLARAGWNISPTTDGKPT